MHLIIKSEYFLFVFHFWMLMQYTNEQSRTIKTRYQRPRQQRAVTAQSIGLCNCLSITSSHTDVSYCSIMSQTDFIVCSSPCSVMAVEWCPPVNNLLSLRHPALVHHSPSSPPTPVRLQHKDVSVDLSCSSTSAHSPLRSLPHCCLHIGDGVVFVLSLSDFCVSKYTTKIDIDIESTSSCL